MVFKSFVEARKVALYWGLLTVLFLATSCGSSKEIAFVPQPQEYEIHENMIADDVLGLVESYKKYPSYQSRIADYLIYERNYQDESYEKLLAYSKVMEGQEPLAEQFNVILREREKNILAQLSEKSIYEIVDYYVLHPEEESFIRPALEQTLLTDMDEYDYYNIHCLHHAFKGTNIASRVDAVYYRRKEDIQGELRKQLNQYCQREREIIDVFSQNCLSELNQYIANFSSTLLEHLLDDELPEEKSEVYTLYNDVLARYLNEDEMQRILLKYGEECKTVINEGRATFITALMPEMKLAGYYHYQLPEGGVNCYPKCPIEPLMAISKIQNKTDYVGWALTTASVAAGLLKLGAASTAIGAVDMARSLKNANDDAKAMTPYIQKVAEQFYQNTQPYLKESTTVFFKQLSQLMKKSQSNFKAIIHENY